MNNKDKSAKWVSCTGFGQVGIWTSDKKPGIDRPLFPLVDEKEYGDLYSYVTGLHNDRLDFKDKMKSKHKERLYTVELEVDVEGLDELEYWSKDVWAKNPSHACSKAVYETKKEWMPQKVDVHAIECVEAESADRHEYNVCLKVTNTKTGRVSQEYVHGVFADDFDDAIEIAKRKLERKFTPKIYKIEYEQLMSLNAEEAERTFNVLLTVETASPPNRFQHKEMNVAARTFDEAVEIAISRARAKFGVGYKFVDAVPVDETNAIAMSDHVKAAMMEAELLKSELSGEPDKEDQDLPAVYKGLRDIDFDKD